MAIALTVIEGREDGGDAPGSLSGREYSVAEVAAMGRELSRLDVGEVRFSGHDRVLYSTDASIYQVEPIGVVVPRTAEQVERVVGYCAGRGVAMLPRGGGTSLAGQCTNRAVVIDFSAFCRGFLRVDVPGRVCEVEAGITIDAVNRELLRRGTGLFFSPDPSTMAQATIGGCVGNNAAGARSIRYGRTSENIAGLDVLLADGSRVWVGAGKKSARARELARRVIAVVSEVGLVIRERFPKTLRRNAGYALDLILRQMDAGVGEEDLDLTGLICGSAGTLGIVLGARLKLHPAPVGRGLAIVSYPSVEAAVAGVAGIVGTGPSAVELLDDVVLEAAAGNAECRGYLELLPRIGVAMPKAVVYCEYEATADAAELDESFARLRAVVKAAGGGAAIVEYRDVRAMSWAWALRRAGEPLLHGIAGHRKPLTFVEDNAVPVERLAEFVAGFKRIVAAHGTIAAYYAHASVGVLHVRPLLDLHSADDQEKMRQIAVEVAELSRSLGGVMSGEHGDGRVRGPLLERYFGKELMGAFRRIKEIFDPGNLLNPGMVVEAGPIESITSSLRTHELNAALKSVDTFFEYSDQDGFGPALERCNGAGVCRKMSGGTMCPSYRGTLDERHSTRGRANALRQSVIVGANDGQPDWADAETIKTLDLCLSCKACKSECPSNVDLARLKAEYTGQRYRSVSPALRERFFAGIRNVNRIGSAMPGLANALIGLGPMRAAMGWMLGISRKRSLPRFERSLMRQVGKRRGGAGGQPRVVLFADCFTAYNETHIGLAAVGVLEALGYRVDVIEAGCCGRAMISTGMMSQAIAAAERALGVLLPIAADPAVRGVVVCEPSCLSAIKDDWLQLRLMQTIEERRALANKAMLVEEFVDSNWDQHPRRATLRRAERKIVLHGHCHQKALWGDATSAGALARCGDVRVLETGCCGMAGSFGYAAEKYELSIRIGEMDLLPAVRRMGTDAIVAAPGTSCRAQIWDGARVRARHPIEVLAEAMLIH